MAGGGAFVGCPGTVLAQAPDCSVRRAALSGNPWRHDGLRLVWPAKPKPARGDRAGMRAGSDIMTRGSGMVIATRSSPRGRIRPSRLGLGSTTRPAVSEGLERPVRPTRPAASGGDQRVRRHSAVGRTFDSRSLSYWRFRRAEFIDNRLKSLRNTEFEVGNRSACHARYPASARRIACPFFEPPVGSVYVGVAPAC